MTQITKMFAPRLFVFENLVPPPHVKGGGEKPMIVLAPSIKKFSKRKLCAKKPHIHAIFAIYVHIHRFLKGWAKFPNIWGNLAHLLIKKYSISLMGNMPQLRICSSTDNNVLSIQVRLLN